nr:hypothetical protein [Tessaracoccus coleopterorum]
MDDVLRLLEELLLVAGLDLAAALEPRDLGLELVPVGAEPRHAGLPVVVGVDAQPVDRIEERADAGLGDPGAASPGPAGHLEGADGLGREAVHLDVVLDLRDEPADLDPVAADLAGGTRRYPALVLVVSGGAELVDELGDLGVGVGDGDRGAVCREDDRQDGDDEGAYRPWSRPSIGFLKAAAERR